MGEKDTSIVSIISRRYRTVKEIIETIKIVLDKPPEIFHEKKYDYMLRGTTLFLIQGVLDLANSFLLLRDTSPTKYSDLLKYLIEAGVVEKEFSTLFDEMIDIRMRLLFCDRDITIAQVYAFLKNNIDRIERLYNNIIKLIGEL